MTYYVDADFCVELSKQELAKKACDIKDSIKNKYPGESVYVGIAYLYGRKLIHTARASYPGESINLASLEIIREIENKAKASGDIIAGPGIVIV